jgi:hypothetical protein
MPRGDDYCPRMSRWWYIVVLIPCALLFAVSRYRPVLLQPCLTMSGNASKFGEVVAASGGRQRVRRGFYLDIAFVAVFAATVPVVLHAGHGWWLVPVIAAGLDATEDAGALVLLARVSPTIAYRLLWLVAATKLLAYAATLVAVGFAAYRGA